MGENAPRQKDNEFREAADRISDYLQRNKQFTLSPIESLELVSQVFVLEGEAASSEVVLTSTDLLEAHAFRLSQFYARSSGGTDEHPIYSDEEWQITGDEAKGSLAYWRWVAQSIEADRAMWPWDREAETAVLIAKTALINIEHFAGKGWIAAGPGAPLISYRPCQSELLGWRSAARSILELPVVLGTYTANQLAHFDPTYCAHLVALRLAPSLQQLHLHSKNSTVSLEGGMRAFERTNSIWVRLAKAAGVSVHQDSSGLWVVAKGPAIKELSRTPSCKTEAGAWREAAGGLIQHLRMRMDISEVKWQKKTPSQQLELIQVFFSESRPPDLDFAFEQLFIQSAKALCRGIGWKVTRGKLQIWSKNEVWHLNQDDSYHSEPTAWLSGAERIRRQVSEIANLSYLEWATLSLDDQILLAQEHLF